MDSSSKNIKMAKFDPHNHERAFVTWRAKGSLMQGITDANRQLILAFIEDMEIGANVNPKSKKGARSFGRLRNIKTKMVTLSLLLQKDLEINSLADLEGKDVELLKFLKKLREGILIPQKNGGKPLKAIGTYFKTFKAFWHWYQRVQRRNGREVQDITIDLDCKDEKPKFNYFTIDDLNKLCNNAKYDYKAMMMFMFDSGIRSPTELMNVRVDDLEWDNKSNHYTLNIREETSKTFGRKIRLLLCSEVIKIYIKYQGLDKTDPLFRKAPQRANQYLRNLGYRNLKLGTLIEEIIDGKKKQRIVDGLSMYDFRHASACYWLPRYKSESALKYRFGWKKSDMIHYYTELLGMKDTIQEEDLYVDISKTELEKQIAEKGKEIDILQERLQDQDKRVNEIMEVLKAIQLDKQIEERIQNAIQCPK